MSGNPRNRLTTKRGEKVDATLVDGDTLFSFKTTLSGAAPHAVRFVNFDLPNMADTVYRIMIHGETSAKVDESSITGAGFDLTGGVAGEVVHIWIHGTRTAGIAGTPQAISGGTAGIHFYRVPSDIQTAAFGCAASAAWEDEDLVALLNAVLVTPIVTARAVYLVGALEVIRDDAVSHVVLFADGGTPSGVDKVQTCTTPQAIGSYLVPVELITDASGNIKIQVDDKDHVTFKFHLRAFTYAYNSVIS